MPKEQGKSLADRIAGILNGQRRLSALPQDIEALAQHYASLLKQRRASQSGRPAALREPRPPTPFYAYHPSPSGDVPDELLDGFQGWVQTDGYARLQQTGVLAKG